MHRHTACGQGAVELLQFSASLAVGSRRWNSCKSPPRCLGAMGSGTPAMHRHTAWGQGSVESRNAVPHRQCGVVLCGVVWRGVAWCSELWCWPSVMDTEQSDRSANQGAPL